MVTKAGYVVSCEAILAVFKEAPEAEAKYNAIELEMLSKITFLPKEKKEAEKSVKKQVQFTEKELDYIVKVMNKLFTNGNVVEAVLAIRESTKKTYAGDTKYYLANLARNGVDAYPVPISGQSIRKYIMEVYCARNNGDVSGPTISKIGSSIKFLNHLMYIADENNEVAKDIKYKVVTDFQKINRRNRNELERQNLIYFQQTFQYNKFNQEDIKGSLLLAHELTISKPHQGLRLLLELSLGFSYLFRGHSKRILELRDLCH